MTTPTRRRALGWAIFAVAFSSLLAWPAAAQEPLSLQQLFEAGQYDAVLQRVAEERERGEASLTSTFIAAQALRRLDQPERAREEYVRLAEQEHPSWQMLGRSGAALAAGDTDEALAMANEAIALEAGLGYAHYQLGLIHTQRDNFEAAARSFARAAELMPAFAYAHYYAGLSFQRVRDINRMAVHFEAFLTLAPEAPERLAVIAIMRSIRGN